MNHHQRIEYHRQLERIHPMANICWCSDILRKSFINFLCSNLWFIAILWCAFTTSSLVFVPSIKSTVWAAKFAQNKRATMCSYMAVKMLWLFQASKTLRFDSYTDRVPRIKNVSNAFIQHLWFIVQFSSVFGCSNQFQQASTQNRTEEAKKMKRKKNENPVHQFKRNG